MGSEYCICPPKITSIWGDGPTRVTFESNWHHKLAVEKIARHFKREMGFDFMQFSAKSKPEGPHFEPYEAYLFHRERYDLRYEDKKTEVVCLGACCFYKKDDGWLLDWVWLHPYFRHKGILWDAWPFFVQRYGDFEMSEPLSAQMKSFIEKKCASEPQNKI